MAMTRTLALISAAVLCASYAHAQPVSCSHDVQCDAGFFCETTLKLCQNCLNCEDLKREVLVISSPTSCIKSVLECGSCLQGLVVNYRRDVNGECVPPDESAAETSLPVYIWSIIGFIILGVFIALIIIIVLRRKDLFRISTATWLRSSCTSNINASAPEPPPPYNPYSAVRPESPFALPDVAFSPDEQVFSEASHDPFIKRAPLSEARAAPARESAGNQNARVYNPPAYVRNVHIDSQSPISELSKEDPDNWPSIHNEDTTPHDWTPNTSTNDTNGNTSVGEASANPESTSSEATSSNLPALLAAARDTTLVAPPPKKLRRQDNNNNGNHGPSSSDSGNGAGAGMDLSAPHASDAPTIYYNIVQINNTKF